MSGHSGYEMAACVEELRGALASHGNCNTGTARRLVEVLGGGSAAGWEVETEARAESVRGVRREIGRRFGREAELCAAELLNNVVRHVGEGAPVRVRAGVGPAGRVRVEVFDRAAGSLPVLVAARGEDESGRGLALVDAVALAWGIEVRGVGKGVWFEVG